eukprot:scaffold75502_cov51-Phaeocystis_antarctica.AAC.4
MPSARPAHRPPTAPPPPPPLGSRSFGCLGRGSSPTQEQRHAGSGCSATATSACANAEAFSPFCTEPMTPTSSAFSW